MATREQDEWIGRVMGVQLAAGGAADAPVAGGDAAGTAARLMGMWQAAKDEVDGGINKLAAILRRDGDPDLEQIADRGLIGVTNGTSVKLTKAFLELRSAGGDDRPKAAAALRSAAQAYRDTLFEHPMADLIDDNPWKVPVGLRAKMGAALDAVIRDAA